MGRVDLIKVNVNLEEYGEGRIFCWKEQRVKDTKIES